MSKKRISLILIVTLIIIVGGLTITLLDKKPSSVFNQTTPISQNSSVFNQTTPISQNSEVNVTEKILTLPLSDISNQSNELIDQMFDQIIKLEAIKDSDIIYCTKQATIIPSSQTKTISADEKLSQLINLRNATGEDITFLSDVYKMLDGTLVGLAIKHVPLFNRGVGDIPPIFIITPFKGNSLIKEIGGKTISLVHTFRLLADGTLMGVADINEGEWAVFKNDSWIKIDEIGGEKINRGYWRLTNFHCDETKTCWFVDKKSRELLLEGQAPWYFNILPDGTLAGQVEINGKWLPFKGDKLIKTIGGKEVEFTQNIQVLPNGDLAGEMAINGKWFPFKGDELIQTIGGKKLTAAKNITVLENGDLAGEVEINGVWFPFKGDELITTIGGKNIDGKNLDIPYYTNILPNGTMSGIVQLGMWLDNRRPFKNNIIIENIAGQRIINTNDACALPDGTLVTIVKTEEQPFWQVAKGNIFLTNIKGRDVIEPMFVTCNTDGSLEIRARYYTFIITDSNEVVF